MRLQHESFVYIVNLCRVIVANYSRTSLRLSHPSEIGALVVEIILLTMHGQICKKTFSYLWVHTGCYKLYKRQFLLVKILPE